MFEIKDELLEFKTHHATNEDLAKEIKRDLQERMEDLPVNIRFRGPKVFYDAGGTLISADIPYEFKLGDNIISCFPQFFEEFVDRITTKCPERGEKVKYHKIHGYMWCIVITPEEMTSLKEQVKDPQLALKAREAVIRKEDMLDELVEYHGWERGYQREEKGHLN